MAAVSSGAATAEGVRLYGVVNGPEAEGRPLPSGACLVGFRDLAAVSTECARGEAGSWRRTPSPPNLDAHRAVVESVFEQTSIVPAPPGVVFRSREAIVRWLELHYVALSDALAFVDGRSVGRVHVERHAPPIAGADAAHERLAGEAVAREIFRTLAGQSVSWTPVATGVAADSAQASFLVDRARWNEFATAVAAEDRRDPALRVWVTGPWPPYDFVRLQFGG